MGDLAWKGEIDDVAGVLDNVARSSSYETDRGLRFAIPARADYERALRDAAFLGDEEELAGRPELAAAAQAHWHAGGHNACVFAEFLSARRREGGWETYVLTDCGSGSEDANALDALVRPRLQAPEVEVVSVLLPHVGGIRRFAEVVRHLGELPDWRLRDDQAGEHPELGPVRRLELAVDVGLDHFSEVLGFGPWEPMAYTRRAPFCELAIRAKPPRRPRRDARAYMAHIEVDLDQPEFGEWWRRTEEQRAARLGDLHDRWGKARVTLTVPEDDWRPVS